MEPLSFSALTVLASLCMPPRPIDVFPLVYNKTEIVLGYPPIVGFAILFGPPVVGVTLEYKWGVGKVYKAAISGSKPEVEKQINKILEPHYCVAIG